jgi:hypothetical protein
MYAAPDRQHPSQECRNGVRERADHGRPEGCQGVRDTESYSARIGFYAGHPRGLPTTTRIKPYTRTVAVQPT